MKTQKSSLSSTIETKLDLILPWLRQASQQLLDHPKPSQFYPEYLRAMHGISRAAIPLMMAAIRRLQEKYRGEEYTSPLIAYFERHILEEKDHDIWILEDLESLGIDPSWTLQSVPQISIASLVGSQYYWIEHHHPIALLGYLNVMESSQPSHESVAQLKKLTGFPSSAFRTMSHHADADIDHLVEIQEIINLSGGHPGHAELITASAFYTAELLLRMLIECNDRFREQPLEVLKP